MEQGSTSLIRLQPSGLSRQQLKDRVWLDVAWELSRLSTCARRSVGCVLVDREGRVLSTGYNGVARGEPHCVINPCVGATCKSGSGLDLCQAIHAEQNALMQCRDAHAIMSCFVTCSPCVHCAKMLLNTSCSRIVFEHLYPGHEQVLELWTRSGRNWLQI